MVPVNGLKRIGRLMTTTAIVVAALGAASAPAALASDGKATLGCSPPYTLDTITDIDAFSQPLVTAGYYTEDSLLALLTSIDHTGDGFLCYKAEPTAPAKLQGFVNLVDNKIISG